MSLLLLVNRPAADESHRCLQPVVEGDQVGREAGSDAPQALTDAQSSGGIGGGHSHRLAEGRQAQADYVSHHLVHGGGAAGQGAVGQ